MTRTSWLVGMERVVAAPESESYAQVLAYQAPYGEPTETVGICSPTAATQLQRQILAGGTQARLVDQVTVTGACPGQVVDVEIPFYLDTTRPTQSATVPATAKLLGKTTIKVTTNASGQGSGTATGPTVNVPTQPVWAVAAERVLGKAGTLTTPTVVEYQAPYGQATERVQFLPPAQCTPVASTQMQSQVLTGGTKAQVTDQVKVTGACPNQLVTVEVPFYLDTVTPVRGVAVPDSAKLLDTKTVQIQTSAAGEGQATVTGPVVDVPTEPVWVVGVERVPGIPGTFERPEVVEYHAPYGQTTETVQFSPPVVCTPRPSTQMQQQVLEAGTRVQVTDQVLVTEACPNQLVSVEVPFYLDTVNPAAANSSAVPATAKLLDTVTVQIQTDQEGRGTATVTGPTLQVPQEPVWVVGMERVPGQTGTFERPTVVEYQALYGQAAETVQVLPPAVCTPRPSTQMQHQVLEAGKKAKLVDQVKLTGACAGQVVDVRVPFYLDTVQPNQGQRVPATATLIDTVTVRITADHNGEGTAVAQGPTIDVPTDHPVWVVGMERVEAQTGSFERAAVTAYTAPYGQAAETVQLAPPVVPPVTPPVVPPTSTGTITPSKPPNSTAVIDSGRAGSPAGFRLQGVGLLMLASAAAMSLTARRPRRVKATR